MKRRGLLALTETMIFVGLSGCTDVIGGDVTELVGAVVANHSSEEQTVHVLVDQNDETVHDSNYDLAPNESDSVECSWSQDSDEVQISARMGEAEERHELDLSDHDFECAYVYVNVPPRGVGIDFAISDDCEHPGAC